MGACPSVAAERRKSTYANQRSQRQTDTNVKLCTSVSRTNALQESLLYRRQRCCICLKASIRMQFPSLFIVMWCVAMRLVVVCIASRFILRCCCSFSSLCAIWFFLLYFYLLLNFPSFTLLYEIVTVFIALFCFNSIIANFLARSRIDKFVAHTPSFCSLAAVAFGIIKLYFNVRMQETATHAIITTKWVLSIVQQKEKYISVG